MVDLAVIFGQGNDFVFCICMLSVASGWGSGFEALDAAKITIS